MARKIALATTAVAALLVSSCTSQGVAENLTVGSAADLYPSQQVSDWVSYADHIAEVTVLNEQELPWGEHEKTHQEGMVDREVTIQTDRVLWSSPGATPPPLPETFTLPTWGWTLKDGEKSPFAALGGPRLEVDHRYLVAWVHHPDGWQPLTNATVLPIDETGVTQRDPLHGDSEFDEAINTFVEKSPETIQAILESTAPDEVAARYFHLRPHQRYKLVVLETEMPDLPGFLKAATAEGTIYTHGALGYVREADWTGLQAAEDTTATIPLLDEAGEEIGQIDLDDTVLDR